MRGPHTLPRAFFWHRHGRCSTRLAYAPPLEFTILSDSILQQVTLGLDLDRTGSPIPRYRAGSDKGTLIIVTDLCRLRVRFVHQARKHSISPFLDHGADRFDLQTVDDLSGTELTGDLSDPWPSHLSIQVRFGVFLNLSVSAVAHYLLQRLEYCSSYVFHPSSSGHV